MPFGAPHVALSAYWPLTGILISQNVKIVVCLVDFCYKVYVWRCMLSIFGSWCITCVFLSRIFWKECPMHIISLRASEDWQTLGIKSLSLDHKHEINQVLFGLTCVADALFTWLYTGTIWASTCSEKTAWRKKQAEHLLKLKGNRKLMQQELSKQSNKIILFKDLSNIHQRVKERESKWCGLSG